MKTHELLTHLLKLNVKLWTEQGELRYRSPSGVITDALLAEIRQHKTTLIKLLGTINETEQPPIIASQNAEGKNLVLSSAQQALWIWNQLQPNSPAYNLPALINFQGNLNVSALESAINEIIRRHQVLRTTFTLVNGQPVQHIEPALPIHLPVTDLQSLQSEQQHTVEQIAQQEAKIPFDLRQAPLLRVRLLKLKPTEHILIFVLHHIAGDAWSVGVLMREISLLYPAFKEGQISPLNDLPIQYSDFALWQKQVLKGKRLEHLLKYWRNQLQFAPPLLSLPTDYSRPSVQTFKGALYRFQLSSALSQSLENFSQQAGVTLFMTLLAAFTTLLYRYSGQEDLCVGTPVANRTQHKTELLVGFFVNTLVLRTDLSSSPSFQELLSRIRNTTLEAYAHQDLPFELLLEELQPERNLSYSPLFQVLFALQNTPTATLKLPDLTVTLAEISSATSKFDLTLSMMPTEQGLVGTFEYSSDLFASTTIARMQQHFEVLLTNIIANSHQKITELSLLPNKERQLILENWNDTVTTYPCNARLHQLLEAQVKQTPDATAVIFDGHELSYQVLNAKANQVAHYLRDLGVTPDKLVAVYLDRSLEMVIALLGILKAGGAYVPLDPTYPDERLLFMLKDCQASVVLTQQHQLEKLLQLLSSESLNQQSLNPYVFCLDSQWKTVSQYSQHNPVNNVASHNLAYVIYTSGSTGQPKGVGNTHLGICNRLLWMQQTYGLSTADTVLQKTPFTFDVSVWEFFWTLMTGARLVLVKPERYKDNQYIIDIITQYEITTLHFVPSMLRLFLKESTVSQCTSLKRVFCSGEALTVDLQNQFFHHFSANLYNLYGPTEAAIDVTYWSCFYNENETVVPIGQPIANTSVYILDSLMQPMPVGVPGELYIGGSCLARGYLNRPDLTAEKFVPNPFSIEPGSRLYKTGDLVRYRPDGSIEFIGRLDYQVKIRGFRIELGEVEFVILQNPDIQNVVVIARDDYPPNKYLVAYLVAHSHPAPTVEALRQFLAGYLPDYIIPTAFVYLDSLPLTSSGKINRRALPAPSKDRLQFETTFVAPQTETERTLANIWAEVLHVEQISIYDNFFNLGGDSIRAIQVRAKAQQVKIDISLQDIFQYKTLQETAQHAQLLKTSWENHLDEGVFSLISESDRRKLPQDVEDAYPLTVLQAGMFFHSEYSSEKTTYHDIFSYNLRVPFDVQALQSSIQQIVHRHPVLRTSFRLIGFTEPLQLVHQQVEVPFQVEDLRQLTPTAQEAALRDWMEAEERRNFDWARPPLLRIYVHRRTEATFQFTLSFHHAILDGWSIASFLTELFHDYISHLHLEVNVSQKPLVSVFREFLALERTARQDQKHKRYWLEKLADSTFTALPRWFKPEQKDGHQSIHIFAVPIVPEVSQGLKQLAQSIGVPLKSVLLAAHLWVLSKLSNQSDVLTGLTTNGRQEVLDGEQVLGLFVNTLPFYLKLSRGSWIDLIRQTFAAEQDCLPYRRYPMADLQRALGGQPLFEVAFNFVHFHIYESVLRSQDIEILGINYFEETNFTLLANFGVNPTSSDVQLNLSCDATQLCVEQIEGIGEYYARALAIIAAQPESHYESHSLLSAREQHQLLRHWNQTQLHLPQNLCVQNLFEAQLEKTPDAVAVVFADQQLTYRQLNNKANQLAHYLQTLGVKPEILVGICCDRSLEMVVGLLGILKAGAAYLPLDPNYPQERVRFMLDDSQAPILITQQHLLPSLPQHQAKTVCIDSDWENIAQFDQNNLGYQITIDNLAYIIYTSGSTGQPKGVQISHLNLVNFLTAMQQQLHLTTTDTLLSVTTLSFDIAALEIFLPLLAGAQIVIVRREVTRDGVQLLQQLADSKTTIMQATPATWQMLLEAGWQENSPPLKILCGGENLPQQLTSQLHTRAVSLWNLYGPTETTIWSTLSQVNDPQQPVTIGYPIANTQCFLLDSNLQPVPIGVLGELYIGGCGLSRGYFNRPELTAEKFIPNPFSDQPGTRLYKTGDLARYRPNGEIEFISRIDHQVKIRGFRIELGEIEAAIAQHPSVQKAIVLVSEKNLPNKRLVAYAVANEGETSYEADLQMQYLSSWQSIYDDIYKQSLNVQNTTLNISGWNSSYTNQPIPEIEMSEWVNTTVERILSLQPEKVLEIGCGTGLLLFQIAPHCTQYWGTDFSPTALEFIQQQLQKQGQKAPRVNLLLQAADNFEGIDAEAFDVVILNSVSQYFPSVDYLLQVLQGAVQAVKPGGYIFVGDVRNLQLLQAFHASVQLHQASSLLSKAEFRQRVQTYMAKEEELLVEPAFFAALKKHLPQINQVKILLKRGRYINELTQFRYDALLQIGDIQQPTVEPIWLDWQHQQLTLPALRQLLLETQPEVLAISKVPNARLHLAIETLNWLKSDENLEKVGDLRKTLQQTPLEAKIDPEDLWLLSNELPYTVDICWSHSRTDNGDYQVILQRQTTAREMSVPANIIVSAVNVESDFLSLTSYVNNPLKEKANRYLTLELQQFVKEKVPDYMMPSRFILLEALPLTPNGKVDRLALLALDTHQEGFVEKYVAPRTPVEEIITGLWIDVLAMKRVGIHDNFFELGGHSLLATQVISRLRSTFSVELPLRSLFDNPTIAELAKYIEASRQNGQTLQISSLVPIGKKQNLALSFAQRRLWFLHQLASDNPFYNIPGTLNLKGVLNITSLQQSFCEIVRRHEILRTTFSLINGEPVQTVQSPDLIPLPQIDLRQLPARERELAAQRLILEEAQKPFDLKQSPLLRTSLLQLDETEYILIFTMHHIAGDLWSMGVLIKEFSLLYTALTAGQSSPLPELPIQYADFADWQHQWLQGDVLASQLAYWHQQLKDAPPILELPTDRPRPPIQSFHGGSQSIKLSPDLSRALQQLSLQEGVTLFMTLFAAFQTLLYRYTHQTDICVGSPIANRVHSQIEPLIGFFVNTLVLRATLSQQMSFRQLLSQVRHIALDAYAHQDLPFERLVEELQPERNLSHTPLFQVMFALQNAPMTKLELPGLSVTPQQISNGTSKFDLSLFIIQTDDGLMATFEYSSDLFEDVTIMRMLQHFETLLQNVVEHPELPLSCLSMLPNSQQRLLDVWNQTQTEEQVLGTIDDLFETQVEANPDRIAVVYGERHLTYQQLNNKANQLADYLQQLGVKPDVPVAICLERSLEMIVALLGVLKAGGTYIPLDPKYPTERLQLMLDDAQPLMVLTQDKVAQKLSSGSLQFVYIEQLINLTVNNETFANPKVLTHPENLAYIIYTSGSTGQPKGVAIEHGSVVNLIKWASTIFNPDDLKGMLASSSLCFDMSVFELFVTLCYGGKLILVENALALPHLSPAHQVTAFTTVPSALLELLRLGAVPPTVRKVGLAGEPVYGDLVELGYQHPSIQQIFNLYGPTEVTVYSTFAQLQPQSARLPAIGNPIPNLQIYILDSQFLPVPIGVIGELYISGVGLARGYFNRPDLTAERFIPNPFSHEAGSRLYKTGDLARYRNDGLIEFLSRVDHQVKVRGFRIELSEVESAILQHPTVQQAITTVYRDGETKQQLIAYVIAPQLSASELKSFLQQKLPEYALPDAFIFLEEFPLTPNGKINRKALPNPDRTNLTTQLFLAPRTAIELHLVQIWERTLKIQHIGVKDNFFELGGHSLLAVRLAAEIESTFGKSLSLSELFLAPTVEQLASVLEQGINHSPTSPLVPIQITGSGQPFYCIHPVGGNVLCYLDLAKLLGPYHPFYGLQAIGLDTKQEPLQIIEDMATCYIEAIRTRQPQGPYQLGGWSLGGVIAFEVAQQLQQQGERVNLLALIDTQFPTNRLSNIDSATLLSWFANDLGSSFGSDLEIKVDILKLLPTEQQLKYVMKQAKQTGVIPSNAKSAQISRLLQICITNLQAESNYKPQIYNNRIVLLQANQSLSLNNLESAQAWQNVALKGLDVHSLPGDHYSIIKPPNVEALAKILHSYLKSGT